MRIIEKTVYTFDELDERAKVNAREWMRVGLEYPWFNEARDSLRAFCDEFGIKIVDYYLGDYRGFVQTDVTNSHFRGLKLSDFDREAMPTGMCFDSSLRYTFADEFKKYGSALDAFKNALESFVCEVERDVDFYYSDESIDESILANGHEFDEFGGIA